MQDSLKLVQYNKEVRECFGENAMVVLLMKTTIWLNPWLREHGIGFDKPVAVILEDKESIAQIVGELRGFETSSVKAITLPPKEIKAHFRTCTYAITFFEFQESRYAMDNLLYIRDVCGEINMDISQRRLAVVFVVGGVSDKYAEYFSGFVYIPKASRRKAESNLECGNYFLHCVIDYVLEKPSAFTRLLEDDSAENFDIAGHVLKALIYSNPLMEESSDKYFEEIDASIEKLKYEWDRPGNSAAVCDLFYEALYNASGSVKMYNRKKVPGISEEEIEQFLYYDKDYYYMPTKMFSGICNSVANPYGEKYIKSQLISTGALVTDCVSRRYGTVHTDLITAYGRSYRKRMIKLIRNCIDKEGYLTLQEALKEETEEEDKKRGIELGWSPHLACKVHIAGDVMNSSILLTGKSGAGKTFAMNMLGNRFSDQGDAVLVLSYNSTFSQTKDGDSVRRINVRTQGLPVSFAFPMQRSENLRKDEEDLIEAITSVFYNVKKFGSRQKRRFHEITKQAVRRDAGDIIWSLKSVFEESEDEVSACIYGWFRELFSEIRINPKMDLFEAGKMTILDFEGFSPDTQRLLAELTLSALWREYRITGQGGEVELYVMADEFQTLNFKEGSVLDQILREGRKYHISMVIATQTLESFDRPRRLIALQAATCLSKPQIVKYVTCSVIWV